MHASSLKGQQVQGLAPRGVVESLWLKALQRGEVKECFDFSSTEKPYESYLGLNVRLRYFVRVTVTRGYGGTVACDFPFLVRLLDPPPR